MKKYNDNMRRSTFCVFMVVFAMIAFANHKATAESEGVTVTIHLFSGRPDPAFTIANKTFLQALVEQIKKAPVTKDHPQSSVIPSKLGYRGIVVENPHGIEGLPVRMAIYDGVMEMVGKEKFWAKDENRQIENHLFQEAIRREVLPPKIIERIKKKRDRLQSEK